MTPAKRYLGGGASGRPPKSPTGGESREPEPTPAEMEAPPSAHEKPRPNRRLLLWGGGVAAALALVGAGYAIFRFPPNDSPEGSYMRIAYAISRGDVRVCFSYLEDRAQHAAYSIRDYRRRATERIEGSYPEPERSRLLESYRIHSAAEDGADVWVDLAQRRGWIGRLRRDLSGIARVERAGDRATIETSRGTRYPFRKRDNGMWGLTLFTGELVAESEKAARDFDVVERAAQDYDRARAEQQAPKK